MFSLMLLTKAEKVKRISFYLRYKVEDYIINYQCKIHIIAVHNKLYVQSKFQIFIKEFKNF